MGQKNYLGKYWLENFKILFKDPSIIIRIKATTKQGGKVPQAHDFKPLKVKVKHHIKRTGRKYTLNIEIHNKTADPSSETVKVRRHWNDIFKLTKEKYKPVTLEKY